MGGLKQNRRRQHRIVREKSASSAREEAFERMVQTRFVTMAPTR